MKKIVIILMFMVNISISATFNDIDENYQYSLKYINKNKEKLNVGDIILYKPLKKFRGSFGHAMVIVENKKIVDFPDMNLGFREMPLEILEKIEHREAIILRYKHMDDIFKERLLDSIYSRIDVSYFLLMPRILNSDFTYCSKFVYNIFEEANNSDYYIFPNDTEFIWPLDFLLAGENFYIVDLGE